MERAREKTRVAVRMTKDLERINRKGPGTITTPGDLAKVSGTKAMQAVQTQVASPLPKERDMVAKTIVCWKSNKVGHMGKECRVRFIESESGDAGNSQSHECSGATSSSGGTNNASSSRVSRISFHNSLSSSDDISQLYFDLSSCSDFSKLDVKMISETCSSRLIAASHDGVSSPLSGGASLTGVSAYDLERVSGVELCDDVLHFNEHPCCDNECMEYVEKFHHDSSEASLLELCLHSRSDDFEHFMSRVSDDSSFHMYDVVCSDGAALSSTRRFDDSARFQPSCNFDEVLIQDVRAVKACCDIILDSGSDAIVLPVSMISAGKASEDQSSFFRDAQGGRIATEGVRDICINLTTVDGKTVTIRDQAHCT